MIPSMVQSIIQFWVQSGIHRIFHKGSTMKMLNPDTVGDTVRDLVYNSVYISVLASVRDLAWNSFRDLVWTSVHPVCDSVEESIKEKIHENA